MQVDDPVLTEGHLRLDCDGGLAVLTLDRPEVLNAQTPATWTALHRAGELLGPEVRVLIVSGAGRAFSAGLDRSVIADGTLARLAGLPDAEADDRIAGYQRAFSWLADPERITIAAVQGHTIGAGFQLALACQLIVAAEDAQFSLFEVALGLVPDLGGIGRLVAAVGERRALEVAASGRRLTAAEADRFGLLARLVPRERLDIAARELAGSFLAQPAAAVRAVTALVVGAAARSRDDQLALERAAQLTLLRAGAGRTAAEG